MGEDGDGDGDRDGGKQRKIMDDLVYLVDIEFSGLFLFIFMFIETGLRAG